MMKKLYENQQKNSAFTLIELLIVVAIIAILAAIAVPNFLEAQVRSKVSRTKADMRSVATALESYRVDGNNYPPDYGYTPLALYSSYLPRLACLTSPIGYMSAIPEDVFAQQGLGRGAANYANPYKVPYGTGPIVHPLAFDYANRRLPSGNLESGPNIWDYICSNSDVVMWALRSPGPKLVSKPLGYATSVYDPTNGTVSDGQIFMTGPGSGFDKPKKG